MGAIVPGSKLAQFFQETGKPIIATIEKPSGGGVYEAISVLFGGLAGPATEAIHKTIGIEPTGASIIGLGILGEEYGRQQLGLVEEVAGIPLVNYLQDVTTNLTSTSPVGGASAFVAPESAAVMPTGAEARSIWPIIALAILGFWYMRKRI